VARKFENNVPAIAGFPIFVHIFPAITGLSRERSGRMMTGEDRVIRGWVKRKIEDNAENAEKRRAGLGE